MLQLLFTSVGAAFLAFAVGLALWVDRREGSGLAARPEPEPGGSAPRLRLVSSMRDD